MSKAVVDMTIEELRTRAAEIRTAVNAPDADLDALETEATQISERISAYETEQRRRAIAGRVAGGEGTVVRIFANRQEELLTSKEYRNAWLKNLQGVELSDAEQRAYTSGNGAISVITANAIMSAVRDHAPLLDRMTIVYSASNISYYVEGTNTEAEDHTENAAITAANDTLSKVSLAPGEITKLIQVSESAKAMSVDAFEAWLARNLGDAISRKINSKIISAIDDAASSAGTAIDAAGVQALLGAVKGDGVAVICNRKTLYTKLLPIQDDSKSSIVRFEGGNSMARVYGVDVLMDDHVADDTVLAGDLTKLIGAMAESVSVRQGYDIDTNSYKYLGVALFDVKVGLNNAFSKLVGE